MMRKNLSFLALLSGLVFLAACGGGMPEEAAEEPMPEAAPAEPEPAPEVGVIHAGHGGRRQGDGSPPGAGRQPARPGRLDGERRQHLHHLRPAVPQGARGRRERRADADRRVAAGRGRSHDARHRQGPDGRRRARSGRRVHPLGGTHGRRVPPDREQPDRPVGDAVRLRPGPGPRHDGGRGARSAGPISSRCRSRATPSASTGAR